MRGRKRWPTDSGCSTILALDRRLKPLPGILSAWIETPFDGLDLAETERLERAYHDRHPWLWRLAELVVFLRDPPAGVRHWMQRRAIGYDGRPSRGSPRPRYMGRD